MSKPPSQLDTLKPRGVTPFVSVETACPMCGAVTAQRKIKPHFFLEQDPDLDLRPRKIVRKRPGLEEYDPKLYFIWLCPQCFFAAAMTSFMDPGQGTGLNGEEIVRGLRTKLQSAPVLAKVAALLGRNADPEVRDRYDALRLTLSAIIQLQSSVASAVQATPTLARYYLRLAWLFYEVENPAEGQEDLKNKVDALTGQLQKVWPSIPKNEKESLKLAVSVYELGLTESRVLEDELDTVKVYLLVARLQAKLGKMAKAKNSWNKGREVAHKFETRRKQEDPGSQSLRIKSENMKNAVKEVADLLTNLSVASDPALGEETKAQEIIDSYFGTDKKELRRILAEEGIAQEVIDHLVPVKKGGLMGLFGKS